MNTYPKVAGGVSMLVPSGSHAKYRSPQNAEFPLQSPLFSRFQPKKSPTRFLEDPVFLE
jgi:hypothetical protein